jgi:hypothetical protein
MRAYWTSSELQRRTTSLLAALVLCLTLGCPAFVSRYDETSYEHFTQLKAFHQKFIEDFTATEGSVWNENAYGLTRSQGDLLFRQAIEYAKGKKDATRVNAFNLLFTQFKDDCSQIERHAADGEAGLPPSVAAAASGMIERNYDYAIRGEFSRLGAPGGR